MQVTETAGYAGPLDKKARVRAMAGLFAALVTRELKGRYRRSILGPAWAVMLPLMYMVVFTFIRGVLDIPSEGVPYVIFTYSALVPWMFFSSAVSRCGPSVSANAGILKKMAVRREVFPVSAAAVSIVDFCISFVILFGMMLYFDVPVGTSILWVPALVLLTFLLALGLGLGLAAVGTFKHDVIYATPFLMQFWLLATPIMYPIGQVPQSWQAVYRLNPMVGVIEGFRAVLVRGASPDMGLLMVSAVGIIIVWAVAWPLFRYAGRYFADVL